MAENDNKIKESLLKTAYYYALNENILSGGQCEV